MKKFFKRILCPIDFDESSYFALDVAHDLAQDNEATLLLLHVVSIAPAPAAGVPLEPYPISEHEARNRLEQVAREHLGDKVDYRVITRIGSPADLVNRAVVELEADSIVTMGARASRGFC